MDRTIIEFEGVSVSVRPPYEAGLNHLSFRAAPGDFVSAFAERGHGRTPLADAAEGLVEPDSGVVRIFGDDWRALAADESNARRGLIGRVFEEHGWVSNLDVDENIVLAQRHHTRRPDPEILDEAHALAERFGLAGVPSVRPSHLRRADRKRAEWVRAFLGTPRLIVLEHPMRLVTSRAAESLLKEVESACSGGAAVIWITSDAALWPRLEERACSKIRLDGAESVRKEGE